MKSGPDVFADALVPLPALLPGTLVLQIPFPKFPKPDFADPPPPGRGGCATAIVSACRPGLLPSFKPTDTPPSGSVHALPSRAFRLEPSREAGTGSEPGTIVANGYRFAKRHGKPNSLIC
jgi:hypothetical protein